MHDPETPRRLAISAHDSWDRRAASAVASVSFAAPAFEPRALRPLFLQSLLLSIGVPQKRCAGLQQIGFAFVALHELIVDHTRTPHSRTSRIHRAHSRRPSICPPTRAPSSVEPHVRPTAKTPSRTSGQPRARSLAGPGQPTPKAPRARPCGSRQHLDVGQVDAARSALDEHDDRPVSERPGFGSRRRVHMRCDPVHFCRPVSQGAPAHDVSEPVPVSISVAHKRPAFARSTYGHAIPECRGVTNLCLFGPTRYRAQLLQGFARS